MDRFHPQLHIGKYCHCSAFIPTPKRGPFTGIHWPLLSPPSPPFVIHSIRFCFKGMSTQKRACIPLQNLIQTWQGCVSQLIRGPPPTPFSSVCSQHLNQSPSLTPACRTRLGAKLTPAQVNENQVVFQVPLSSYPNKKHQETYPSRR